jgi:ClpP class serine protease
LHDPLQPVLQKQWLAATRRRMLASISQKRDATVITLIHRQETISLLGFPIMRHIDIDDSQSVLRAIRSTPPGRGIEIILHTPGGLVLAGSKSSQRHCSNVIPSQLAREYFPGRPIPGFPQGRETPRTRESR